MNYICHVENLNKLVHSNKLDQSESYNSVNRRQWVHPMGEQSNNAIPVQYLRAGQPSLPERPKEEGSHRPLAILRQYFIQSDERSHCKKYLV